MPIAPWELWQGYFPHGQKYPDAVQPDYPQGSFHNPKPGQGQSVPGVGGTLGPGDI